MVSIYIYISYDKDYVNKYDLFVNKYKYTHEVINVSFLGVNRFIRDIEIMLGKKMIIWWKVCWMVISPIAILVSTARSTELVFCV